ncbi:hypothetical protein BDP27DRAFT_1372989 [Rhodocollybia butyracea]|uniref:Uncharacterized protein n=1 Tax=Rhodocollybia butyracea TaxID=206335 RepID=A0A9P5TWA4_9AGAR|nr:hypothetical protein BDP27DRAFT_1372989 [Rhodocollybia butyracea]
MKKECVYAYSVESGHNTRSVTNWNIWQQWYAVHGEQKKPTNMPVSEWTVVVRNEFDAFLHSKLAKDNFDNPEAHEEALEEQITWFWQHHDTFIEQSIAKGNGTKMVTKILRPIVQMANRVYRETGFHIGGYAWHPDVGASIFVGTKTLEKVKSTNGTQMLAQANDIGSCRFSVAKLVERKVEAELAELYRHCIVKKESRDRHRAILPRVFAYDMNRVFENEEGGVPKLTFSNFVECAWKHQVRVKNWPAGVPFLNIGVMSKKGYMAGVDMLNKYKAGDLNKICGPRIQQIEEAVSGEDIHNNLLYFEIERWTDEERKLGVHQLSTIPVVSDTENNTVAFVAHSSSYRIRVGDAEPEHAVEHDAGTTTKDSGALALFASDSDDDDTPQQHIDDPGPSRRSNDQGRSAW